MDYNAASLKMHEEAGGKLEVALKVPVETKDDLSTAYTPGVAEPCRKIAENPDDAYKYTLKQNTVAVVSDGTAVLGLGDIGPLAAIPVMEGKSVLFKRFGNVDAFPICIDTKDTEEIIETVKRLAPSFGGINLEDISAPRCFEIEARLRKNLISLYSMMISMVQLSLLQQVLQMHLSLSERNGKTAAQLSAALVQQVSQSASFSRALVLEMLY